MKLSDFKIRSRVFMVLAVPSIGLMLFAGQQLLKQNAIKQESIKLAAVTRLVPVTGNLVHEIQKERGMSVGFLNLKGESAIKTQLDGQRQLTDDTETKFLAVLDDFRAENYGAHMVEHVKDVREKLETIALIRDKVSMQSTEVGSAVKVYTAVISSLLDMVAETASFTNNAKIGKALSAFNDMEMAKEYAGIERATGVVGFNADMFTTAQFIKLVSLMFHQDGLLESANDMIDGNPELSSYVAIKDLQNKDVDEMRQIVLNAGANNSLGGRYNGNNWFQTTTQRINQMKAEEDKVAGYIIQELDNNLSLANGAFMMALIETLIFLALTSVLGLAMVYSITKPIAESADGLRKLADHQLDFEISGTDRKDEVGDIARTMKVFRENIIKTDELTEAQRLQDEEKRVLQRRTEAYIRDFELTIMNVLEGMKSADSLMRETADEMNSGAEKINVQSITVASGAEEASTNVQTVASSAEELSASIQEISRQVTASSQVTRKAIEAADEATGEIKHLEGTVSRIGNVVQLITDIAEQTNLLALNATIEAARAGNAGKGFAVVASEVKGLASQTAKATEEISQQIKDVQISTQSSAKSLLSISDIISEISSVSASISSAVEQQSAATREIAKNVEQASRGTLDVSRSISEVLQSTERTKKTAEAIKLSSQALTDETQSLNDNVAAFLLKVRSSEDASNGDIIKWSDDIAVGNKTIDEEHKKLVGIINKTYALVREGNRGNELASCYKEMKDYTDYHFKHEEEAMQKVGYPDLQKHKSQHSKFVEKLDKCYQDYASGKEKSGESLLNLLGSWWVSHILTSDKKLSAYLGG